MALWGKTDTLASAPKYISPSIAFDASANTVVDLTADTIAYPAHVFSTGDFVNYANTGGTNITGLTGNANYYVIRVDGNTIKLASNSANAIAGTQLDLSGLGVGTHNIKLIPAAFFVDVTEAGVESNRDAGLKTAGWNTFTTYTAASGETRRKVEPLVAMRVTAVAAGDAGVTGNTSIEDATVADS
jgi:hypothetical protein